MNALIICTIAMVLVAAVPSNANGAWGNVAFGDDGIFDDRDDFHGRGFGGAVGGVVGGHGGVIVGGGAIGGAGQWCNKHGRYHQMATTLPSYSTTSYVQSSPVVYGGQSAVSAGAGYYGHGVGSQSFGGSFGSAGAIGGQFAQGGSFGQFDDDHYSQSYPSQFGQQQFGQQQFGQQQFGQSQFGYQQGYQQGYPGVVSSNFQQQQYY